MGAGIHYMDGGAEEKLFPDYIGCVRLMQQNLQTNPLPMMIYHSGDLHIDSITYNLVVRFNTDVTMSPPKA